VSYVILCVWLQYVTSRVSSLVSTSTDTVRNVTLRLVMLKTDFSTTSSRLAETVFLPVIKRLLSIDCRGIGVCKEANLSAELEYSFFSKITNQVYSRG